MFFRDATMSISYYGLSVGNNTMNLGKKMPCSFGISKDNFIMRLIHIFYRSSVRSQSIVANRFQKILPSLVVDPHPSLSKKRLLIVLAEAFSPTCMWGKP